MTLPVAILGPAEAWTVASRTRRKPWIVVQLADGRYACSCPANVVCAHVKSVREVEDHRALRVVRSES